MLTLAHSQTSPLILTLYQASSDNIDTHGDIGCLFRHHLLLLIDYQALKHPQASFYNEHNLSHPVLTLTYPQTVFVTLTNGQMSYANIGILPDI